MPYPNESKVSLSTLINPLGLDIFHITGEIPKIRKKTFNKCHLFPTMSQHLSLSLWNKAVPSCGQTAWVVTGLQLKHINRCSNHPVELLWPVLYLTNGIFSVRAQATVAVLGREMFQPKGKDIGVVIRTTLQ